MSEMICLSCSNCKHYMMKNGDSYCTKKQEVLTFLERNWTGSWRKIHCCNTESNNCGIVINQQATIMKLKEINEELKNDLEKLPPKIKEVWIE